MLYNNFINHLKINKQGKVLPITMAQKSNKIIMAVSALAIVSAIGAPLAASAITANTTINAAVGSTITKTTSGTVGLTLNPDTSARLSSNSDTVTINCNSVNGYTLTLADADGTQTLTSGANTIAAHSGTPAAPTALADNTWGWAVAGGNFDASYSAENNVAGSTTKGAGIPATGSPYQLKDTSAVATNEITTVWYAAEVTSAKPTGTYTDQVIYTALAK